MRSLFARMFAAFALVTVGASMAVSAYYDAALGRRQEQRVELVADAMRLYGAQIAESEAMSATTAGPRADQVDAVRLLRAHTDARLAVFVDGERIDDGSDALADSALELADDRRDVRWPEPSPERGVMRRTVGDETWLAYVRTRGPNAAVVIVAALRSGRTTSAREIRIVLLIVVTALVSFLLARLLTRPIRMLRVATRRIAEGDTSVRVGNVARGAGDEIAGLAADFDRMTARIEGLLETREALLRDVSHELRSPLARLQVALGIARQRGADGALLDRMEKETERLGELIGLVLSMARLEQAREIASPADVRLDELVMSLVADATFEAEGSKRSVRIVRTEPISVRGDAELLRQATENVVRNALRFAPDESSVDIELVRVNGASVELRVRDHGPGVPEAALTEIFRPFTRVEAARERTSGGAGIGLAITERAVRLHEGTVVASNAEGGGLCVTIRLPAARA